MYRKKQENLFATNNNAIKQQTKKQYWS